MSEKPADSPLTAWGHPYAYFVLSFIALQSQNEKSFNLYVDALAHVTLQYDFRLVSLTLTLNVFKHYYLQNYQQAVELIGFLLKQNQSVIGWLNQWDLFQQLLRSLKEVIGDEMYKDTLNKGELLPIKSVVKQVSQQYRMRRN